MQTTTTAQKQTQQPSSSRNRQMQSTVAARRPAVRTTEIQKMIQIVLTDPDSVTHAEFMLFQRAIGFRQAVGLMEEGRRRKRIEKGEQPEVHNKANVDTKGRQGTNTAAVEKKQDKDKPRPTERAVVGRSQ